MVWKSSGFTAATHKFSQQEYGDRSLKNNHFKLRTSSWENSNTTSTKEACFCSMQGTAVKVSHSNCGCVRAKRRRSPLSALQSASYVWPGQWHDPS